MPQDKIAKLENLLKLADQDYISHTEMEEIFATFLTVVKDLKVQLEKEMSDKHEMSMNECEKIVYEMKDIELRIEKMITESKQAGMSEIKTLANRLNNDIERVRSIIPTLPDLSYIDRQINDLEKKIPRLPPPVVLDDGEEIVDKINDLAIRSDLQIDASHIKNLPKPGNNPHGGMHYLAGTGITIEGNVISSSGGHTIENDGTPLTQRSNLNFTGAGVSVADTGGKTVVTISGGGGVISGYQAATGTVNGSNTSFTFATAPNVIQVDGVQMQKTSSDGTVNWTGTTSVTLTVAPSWDIFSPA